MYVLRRDMSKTFVKLLDRFGDLVPMPLIRGGELFELVLGVFLLHYVFNLLGNGVRPNGKLYERSICRASLPECLPGSDIREIHVLPST